MRRAARKDDNEKEIVQALRDAGGTLCRVDSPQAALQMIGVTE